MKVQEVPPCKQFIGITDSSRRSNMRTLSKHMRKKKKNCKLRVRKNKSFSSCSTLDRRGFETTKKKILVFLHPGNPEFK